MTVSWPHTFRNEQAESFHEQSAEESVWVKEGMTQQTGEYYKMTLKYTYIYTYIPCIQKFAKITVGYGIINIQNVKNIWNFLNTKYYKDVSIILHLKNS
jgi:hypothetical protein